MMSKGLRNMTKSERDEAIKRRLNSDTKGLGWWAAVDAKKRQQKEAQSKTE